MVVENSAAVAFVGQTELVVDEQHIVVAGQIVVGHNIVAVEGYIEVVAHKLRLAVGEVLPPLPVLSIF